MAQADPALPIPPDPAGQRRALLELLRLAPRGAAQRHGQRLRALIAALEQSRPADLAAAGALEQLEGVWSCAGAAAASPTWRWGPGWRTCSCWRRRRGGA